MDIESIRGIKGEKLNILKNFLSESGIEYESETDQTVIIWDGNRPAATGSRTDNILKYIAVDPSHQGEDLTSTLLTALRGEAFREGHRHLFLYTKPTNKNIFSSLFFYPVAETDKVLLMENKRNGIREFLNSLPTPDTEGISGAAVMNCNPFTLGHQYLIETAARQCDRLYVFVLSEDKSEFSTADRTEMVKRGTAHLSNVTVLPTGPYLISSATFPTYFLKDRENAAEIQCLLDIEIFAKYFAPKFSISRRYVGTEPLSPMTNQYNEALKKHLPAHGIELCEIPRLENDSIPISASAVRALLASGNTDLLSSLLPQTSIDYLKRR